MSGVAFFSDDWMPVPYKTVFPSAYWVAPDNPSLGNCTLGPVTRTPTHPDLVLRQVESWLPDYIIDQYGVPGWFDNWMQPLIAANRTCEIGAVMMNHTVVDSVTCPIFEACWALMYNSVSMTAWGWPRNEWWSYDASVVSTYHATNYQKFKDYWSNYGDPQSPMIPTQPVLNKEGPWQPFIYAKVDATVDRTGRQFYAQELFNIIRQVADATFGYPNRGKSARALMSYFYFGGPLTNIDGSWS
jgi:hypothetical protein